jgi:hypothetical protein
VIGENTLASHPVTASFIFLFLTHGDGCNILVKNIFFILF